MGATQIAERLLDERGVKWTYGYGTVSYKSDGHWCNAWEHGNGMMCVSMGFFTPEQAIAATLGSGNCSNDCTNSERTGTCHNASVRLDESRFHCSECGFGCWVKDVADGRDKLPRFCPNCGRKVMTE